MTEPVDLDAIRARLAAVPPGPWFWHGNTDNNGDVGLCGRIPGKGVVDVLRTVREDNAEKNAAAEWDADRGGDLQDAIDREDYIEQRANHPHRYLAVGDGRAVTDARDHAVYEVARRQGLPDDTPPTHPKVYRRDVVDVRLPTARFLAHCWQDIADLLGEVERLRGAL